MIEREVGQPRKTQSEPCHECTNLHAIPVLSVGQFLSLSSGEFHVSNKSPTTRGKPPFRRPRKLAVGQPKQGRQNGGRRRWRRNRANKAGEDACGVETGQTRRGETPAASKPGRRRWRPPTQPRHVELSSVKLTIFLGVMSVFGSSANATLAPAKVANCVAAPNLEYAFDMQSAMLGDILYRWRSTLFELP